MYEVKAHAPTRVDLAGGTLDIKPLSAVLDHAATVNFGISLFASIELSLNEKKEFSLESNDQACRIKLSFEDLATDKKLPLLSRLIACIWDDKLPGLELRTDAQSPAGAGLGGSSCLGVALAAGIFRLKKLITGEPEPTDVQLIQIVQDIETKLIHCPTGCQDYWGAYRGGINFLRFLPGQLKIDSPSLNEFSALNERLVICYSGKSRASGINNWEIFKQVFDGDHFLLSQLNEMGACALELMAAIDARDWSSALAISQKEWSLRKKLWKDIETPETRSIDELAKSFGAEFSRVCGAGGGGVMAVFCRPELRESLVKKLRNASVQVLDAQLVSSGLQISHSEL